MVSTADVFEALLVDNEAYAQNFTLGGLGSPPARQLAVVTCMDARIDPLALLGLAPGDLHVLRNAGGRVCEDVLRSLIVSVQVLGVEHVALIQHTDCGMAKETDAQLRELVASGSGADPEGIQFLTISDHVEALHEDLSRVATCPYLPDLDLSALLYDVRTGKLSRVL